MGKPYLYQPLSIEVEESVVRKVIKDLGNEKAGDEIYVIDRPAKWTF